MSHWRFISEVGDVAYNLAVTEVMLRSVGNLRANNTLRVAYCNPNSVILGIQHIPSQVINIPEIRNLKFNIARRLTSGSPIFFTDKQIAIQFFVYDQYPTKSSLKNRLIDCVIKSFENLGLKVSFQEPHKLICNGKMIAYVDILKINHGLSISLFMNVDNDSDYRERILTDKYASSLKNYIYGITNLNFELGGNFSKSELIESFKSLIKKEFEISFSNESINQYENLLLKSHIEKHTMSEWILGFRNISEFVSPDVKSVTINTKEGFITVVASTNRGLITNIHISGDFYIYPPEALNALEVGLKFSPADDNYIQDYVARYIKVAKVQLYGIKDIDIVEAIKKAVL
jgi:Lipoate-protein ligase A